MIFVLTLSSNEPGPFATKRYKHSACRFPLTLRSRTNLRAAALARRDALDPCRSAPVRRVAIAARMPPLDVTPSTSRRRLCADPQRDRSRATDAERLPRVARRLRCRRFQRATPRCRSAVDARRRAGARRLRDFRAVRHCVRGRPGYRAGAARRVRPRRPSYRLWRRLLRPHAWRICARHKTVIAIGLAFAVQEIPQVPALSHDVRLDYVLTETDLFDFRSL